MNIKDKVAALEKRVDKIEERNRRVEGDKAWELSKTRSAFIAISTYLLIYIFMKLINDDHPFLNALVASIGYIVSNSTYGFIKKWWLNKYK